MKKRTVWIAIIGCLLVVGLASISAFGRVGPLAGVFGGSGIPECGYAWRPVAAASASKSYNELHALAALSRNDVWAAGIFGGEQFAFTLVEHWDGTNWTESPSPSVEDFSNHLYGMAAISTTDVWIVGASHQGTDLWRTLALHWDGSEWAIVPTPNTANINNLNSVAALASDDIWAAGDSSPGNRTTGTQALVMHWNGEEWRVVETGITEQNATLNAVAAIGPEDVWAAGSYSDRSGTVLKPLLIHWDGAKWQAVEGNSYGAIWGLSALSASDAWAVGDFGPQTLALHWDGAAWKRVATPNPGDGKGNNVLNAVASLSRDEVWAAGSYNEGGKDRALAMNWDGKEWKQVPAPSLGNYSDVLSALVAVPGTSELWAAGASIADQLGNNLPVILRYTEPCK